MRDTCVQLLQRMEQTKSDLQMVWREMEDERVDFIFEQMQNLLLSLKQKIKDGSATSKECFQACMLLKEANLSNLFTSTNVNDVTDEDIMEKSEFRLQLSESNGNRTGSEDNSLLNMEEKEKSCSENEEAANEIMELPLTLPYQNHNCSTVCLANRPLTSYKSENPLKIPILCQFQRRHAKADCLSKSHDVNYKAPCGRSLRNFEEVQNYLLETECDFLSVDHFSFNTYVQLGRNTVNREPLVFDFDISNGAEVVPISFCNDIDRTRLPFFKYRKASWPRGYYLNNFSSTFVDSCDCTDGCTDRLKCACLQLTARGFSESSMLPNKALCGYKYKRLEMPITSGIYECNVSCKCNRMLCQNRVVQHGIQVRLQVFNTEKKGWGVRCLDDIDKGTFVCTYSGRLMSRAESQETGNANHEDNEQDAKSGRSHSSLPKKRRGDVACSDSEIEVVQTGKGALHVEYEPLTQPADAENKPPEDEIQGATGKLVPYNRSYKREGFYTNMVKICGRAQWGVERKGLLCILKQVMTDKEGSWFSLTKKSQGVDTLVHDATSDEDSSLSQQSTKLKPTTGTKRRKGKLNLQQELEDLEETMQVESTVSLGAKCKEGTSPQDLAHGKLVTQGDAYAVKKDKALLHKSDFKEENFKSSKQDPFCHEMLRKNSDQENIYLLDATKEGNGQGKRLSPPSPAAEGSGAWQRAGPRCRARGFHSTYGARSDSWRMRGACGRALPPLSTPTSVSPRPLLAAWERRLVVPCPVWTEARGVNGFVRPAVTSQIMAKMVRRRCAFCPEGEESSIMYISEEQNLAVHQDCLLYSSGFVESEEYNPHNLDIRFDVASVLSEIKRGKRLMCNFCRKKGATVGCEERACRRSYHYFCARCDDAAIETDEVKGIYRVFCPKHDPGNRNNHYGKVSSQTTALDSTVWGGDAVSRRRRQSIPSTIREAMSTEETAEENSLRVLRNNNRHKVRIDFLRKCKQAGLLDDIFEAMLDTLHLAQEKLMDDNTSETEYEETVTSLFECGLFENILTNAHSGTEEKIQELLETRKRLDTQIELLQELKEEVVLPVQENRASASSSVSE
ncbi:PREDICTED: histone-lysine N-methyltransferase SETDB2-like [Gavialis gangeticus]|uniref:histone-lysine N-methyltransferase SETDB2-like n=1 Tax=Gavialis gangeticus TaxID=94835 RepID=UPI00092E4AD5|nr:PREDICTED: histone-lysine N-methyltransferase SETDB2-like [Gavialis gangeticus]